MNTFFNDLDQIGLNLKSFPYTELFKDKIHLNELGSYLIALLHYNVLYQTPVAKNRKLTTRKGETIEFSKEALAQYMNQISWKVAKSDFHTGLIPYSSNSDQ